MQTEVTMQRNIIMNNAEIKEAVDFITGKELMAVGDKERLRKTFK